MRTALNIVAVVVLAGLLAFATPGVSLAQTADYTKLCSNTGNTTLPLPETNPCPGLTGVWVAVEFWNDSTNGTTYGKKNFSSYEELLAESKEFDGGSAWFEPGIGATAVTEPVTASEVTTKATTLKGAVLKKEAVVKAESTEPTAWTESVCAGEAAIVFQSVDKKGDGVTVKTDDESACATNQSWFVVEPWGSGTMNPDRGCFADDWSNVDALAKRTGWTNGSAWAVGKDYITNPVVVNCDTVNSSEGLGLNRFENQVFIGGLKKLVERAVQLITQADMSLPEYCTKFGSEPLGAQILCTELAK
jgi:hypothetical protein